MRRLTTSEKFADTCIMTVFCVIIASGLYCFFLGVMGNVNQHTNHQNYFDGVALGQPCDIRDLKSYPNHTDGLVGSIEHTKGLHCYIYDTLFPFSAIHNGIWAYPNGKDSSNFKGVWVYPRSPENPFLLADSGEVEVFFNFFPLENITKNWQAYKDPIGKYSFKLPSGWRVVDNSTDNSRPSISIEQRWQSELVYNYNITYHPNSDFYNSEEYKPIKEAPDFWFIPDTSRDISILTRHFNLNGNQALLVQTMPNYSTDYNNITVYVIKKDSYLTIEYPEYSDSSDLLMQVLIRTLQF